MHDPTSHDRARRLRVHYLGDDSCGYSGLVALLRFSPPVRQPRPRAPTSALPPSRPRPPKPSAAGRCREPGRRRRQPGQPSPAAGRRDVLGRRQARPPRRAAKSTSAGKPGGQLIVANWDEPISLDPPNMNGSALPVTNLMFDRLVVLDKDLKPRRRPRRIVGGLDRTVRPTRSS